MRDRRRALVGIDRDLRQAARILDGVARKIRDARLAPRRNISRAGHALVHIFDVQGELHRERPDLIPKYLRGTAYEKLMLSNSGWSGPPLIATSDDNQLCVAAAAQQRVVRRT